MVEGPNSIRSRSLGFQKDSHVRYTFQSSVACLLIIPRLSERLNFLITLPIANFNFLFNSGVDMNSTQKFQTKEQLLYRLQEGVAFGDGEEYTPMEYQKMAIERALEWQKQHYGCTPEETIKTEFTSNSFSNSSKKREMTPENLENDYWNLVETQSESIEVEYGNDIDTIEYWSGFPLSERGRRLNGKKSKTKCAQPEPKFGTEDFYKETWWNLNNIPCCPESILRHVKVGINGINVPWLYFGSLFSTFCWHNEDNYLYSINYHHKGCPKQWYGVPGTRKDAEGLERVFKNCLSMKMRDVPDLLHHITTMFSPRLLQQGGVPVYKLLQYPGEFVVTFPRSYHGGFSMGPNVGEAVNFATHDWIAHGADASERYRSFSRAAVFSHDRLTFTMANHHKEQQYYRNCTLLVKELNRVIDEEIRLRAKLIESGVRDVYGIINLPKNRLDQLDEESADYDDKRLCHACKHVCFFSAVGCDCSHSKVSCLRHSQYMCRCPPYKKYLMTWSTNEDMQKSLSLVKNHCEQLKTLEPSEETESASIDASEKLPSIAPGVLRDKELHKNDFLNFACLDESSPRKHTNISPGKNYAKEEEDDLSPLSKRFKRISQATLKLGPVSPGDKETKEENKSHDNTNNDDVVYITTCPSKIQQ